MRLIFSLCLETNPQIPQQRAPAAPKGVEDVDALQITTSAIGVLKRLAEKSKNPDDPQARLPVVGLPSPENLLGALRIAHPRLQGVLKQLCIYAGLAT
jgi:SWI/SNF chromatin-remodeling complex subunit SWI1